MTTLTREYKRLRRLGWHASNAYNAAKTREAWDAAEAEGFVRLVYPPDECVSLDDLKGDCFNPKYVTHISRSQLEREEKAFEEKVNREGVYGIVGEYFDGETWQQADSCWGFLGDDLQDNGYETDCMALTLEALEALEHCPTCGRPKKGDR
ncbi:MAG TPA: hypothetical protein VK754_09785 [Propionibacteriaceae bacterium]|nr:hypothetical protein [Propionibacteriaceae bacterium]